MAIRVYELSKKLGISNKDLLELLKKHGFTLTSIGVVPDEALALIEKVGAKNSSVVKNEQPVVQLQKKIEPQKPIIKVAPQQIPIVTKPHPEKVSKAQHEPESKISQLELVLQPMSVADLALKAHKNVSEVILTLLKQGIVATKNQILTEKTVSLLAEMYGVKIIQKATIAQPEKKQGAVSEEGVWKERFPVVVVIGHVDHGKTTLLDYIRKTRVAAKEKGGITQHLGAYEVTTPQGDLVFLDTPGHEAFSLMRVRGIKIADIAILVVAADDGVMPQTVEAIKKAKLAGIPLIVALNKVDKATPAQIETTKRQLAQHDLVPEEWGGQTPCLPISAKLGTGVDNLLEVIVLQAQLMDLKANLSIPARGYVLESKIEKGRGPVATVICQHGVLHVGDYFLAGSTGGKVSSLVDSHSKRVNEINPPLPVQVAGFLELPQAGDIFEVTTQEAVKKGIVPVAEQRIDMYLKQSPNESAILLIVKTDNASSREALINALSKLHSEHRKVTILTAGVGDITESDIMLAADTAALIYGFHVKVPAAVMDSAQKKGITIRTFDIIYKLLEDIEVLLQAGKPVKMVSKKIGEASVLKVFDIKGLGIIAGAHVKNGRFVKDGKVIIWRGKQKVGEGTIKGLQRDRKAVKEVHAGFECAFLVDGFESWEVDDRVECYQEVLA